ncbi:MAG: translation elongation factor Ts [Thioalkalispiraceae bacterium]|jgi:elongation factor Ts
MAITAAQVKELRERTGVGMMECKKALTETDGDIDAAIELLRKSGQAKADKKAGRTAAEGLVVIRISDDNKTAAVVEVNCETDFAAKDENFSGFVNTLADHILATKPADMDALMASTMNGETVEEALKNLIAKVGENMNIRRFEIIEGKGNFASYMHGVRIGVLVDLQGGDEALGKDLAMHIAASRPICVAEDDVPQEAIDKEKEIFAAQAAESGKPADIIEKMISGRIKKFLKEITLLGQPFVKDPDQTVEKLLKDANASVVQFIRYEVGEGIEKKQENFADEVAAQIKG